MEPSQPPLPRPPGDEENLRLLRKEAAERMAREEPLQPRPGPSYGPAPVYGGPPIITRRWTLRGVLMFMLSALAALAALWGYRKATTPVYGGPPVSGPSGPTPPATVYGGPPPPQENQRPPAPVYGGPPPPSPQPPPAPPK